MEPNNLSNINTCVDTPEIIAHEKKNVSRIFGVLTLSAICAYVAVFCVSILLSLFVHGYETNHALQLLLNDSYTFITIAFFIAFSGKSPSQKPLASKKMTAASFVKIIVSLIAVMFLGAIAGNYMSFWVGSFIGHELTNSVDEVLQNYSLSEIFVSVVIVAPISEELLFRKLFINKTGRYGTVFSIIVSGMVFGAFHGNFYQFFYASAAGMILAYVYCVYGKLRYTIVLHSILNFIGSVVSVYFAELAQSPYLIDNLASSLYSLAYIATVPFGIIFVIKGRKNLHCYCQRGVLELPSKTLVANFGLIAYAIYSVATFIIGFMM